MKPLPAKKNQIPSDRQGASINPIHQQPEIGKQHEIN